MEPKLEQRDECDVVQIMPAPGWRVYLSTESHGVPLVGWGLMRRGDVCPLIWDEEERTVCAPNLDDVAFFRHDSDCRGAEAPAETN